MGVTWEQFWKLNPRKLDSIFAGYKAKLKEDDYKNWLNGIYTQSAVFVSIDIALNGRKSKSKMLSGFNVSLYITVFLCAKILMEFLEKIQQMR